MSDDREDEAARTLARHGIVNRLRLYQAANDEAWFEHNVTLAVEGWRTSILTCLVCGASVTLSRTVDTAMVHQMWHEGRDESPGGAS